MKSKTLVSITSGPGGPAAADDSLSRRRKSVVGSVQSAAGVDDDETETFGGCPQRAT